MGQLPHAWSGAALRSANSSDRARPFARPAGPLCWNVSADVQSLHSVSVVRQQLWVCVLMLRRKWNGEIWPMHPRHTVTPRLRVPAQGEGPREWFWTRPGGLGWVGSSDQASDIFVVWARLLASGN